ncbi:MAG: pyridoxal phosphate-dependent aminotransferase [Candidatus Omnitrophica bacterium]|nr:pyridoxal phosphate-dependent aminotransferase [Candidatus Omnitrophota bacterium]
MKSPDFANRANWEQTANLFHRKCTELRQKGTELLDLTVSNPTQCGFEYLNPALLAPLQNQSNLEYTPDPRGLLSCRAAIASYYKVKGIQVEPSQIFVTANTSEAYSFVFKLLLDPGDSMLAPEPSYPLIDYLASLNDIEIARYSLDPAQKWKMKLEGLQKEISKADKALLLVHPNNPTGNYVSDEERQAVNKLARENGWSLIVDEVFLDYSLKDSTLKNGSFAGNKEALTFTLSGISKILGLPQMKLSWIVVSGPEKESLEALSRLEILADTYLSASTPSQNALPAWLERTDEIQKEILTRVQNNYEWFEKEYQNSRFPGNPPEIEGGWCLPIKLPSTLSDEAWALHFLEESHAIVHPGYLYDFSEGSWIVVSLLVPPRIFQEGIGRIFKTIR